MKKIILVIALLISSLSIGQELMNYYLSPNTLSSSSNGTTLMLHTTILSYDAAGLNSYEYTIEGNIINFKMCYVLSSIAISTLDHQAFEIKIPSEVGDFTINIELISSLTNENCTTVFDEGSMIFSLPYNPTEKIDIPDLVFENYLEIMNSGDGIDGNNLVYKYRIENISFLYFNNSFFNLEGEIEKLTGIKYFESLKKLWCSDHQIETLNLSYNTELEELSCARNLIEKLDLSNNIKLKTLICGNTGFSIINLSNNILLESVHIGGDEITNIDLSNNISLVRFSVNADQLNNIDLTNNNLIEELSINNTIFSTVNVTNLVELKKITIQNTPLTSLNLPNNINLSDITIKDSFLTSLDLTNNINLTDIYIENNQILANLDVTSLSNLVSIYCNSNKIESLDLSSSVNLFTVFLLNNNLNYLNIANGNNEELDTVITYVNPNLFCIQADISGASQPFGYQIDSQTQFNEICTEPTPLLDKQQLLSSDIFIYPNPTNNILNIESQSLNIETIKIINLQGVIIKEITNSTQINVLELATGIYFIQISSEGNSVTKKFIKI